MADLLKLSDDYRMSKKFEKASQPLKFHGVFAEKVPIFYIV